MTMHDDHIVRRQTRRPNGVEHYKNRGVRVPDHVWEAAKAEAHSRGVTLSSEIVRMLDRYGKAHQR